MAGELDYLDHIRRESARFAACLGAAEPSARVPSCPDWTAADLLWHLAEVQLFWGAIVRDRLADPDAAEADKPDRPDDYGELLALFDGATTALIDALSTTPPDTEVWTWAADHHVSFVSRRQAHEALIHRLDAELVIGEPTGLDAALASDGVDEALAVVHGDLPTWATFTPDGVTGTVEASDTGAAWRIGFGRFVGIGPDSGKRYDMDALAVIDATATPASFTSRATAADLDAWLWGRAPIERIVVDGDRDAFARLEQIVSRGVD
jgi:uncharacterized protein (TIGR03083 family)